MSPPGDNAPAVWHTELREGLAAASLDPQVLASWWTTLDDPILTGLIDKAVNNNLDLRQAEARVREARARRGISQAGLFPVVDASGGRRPQQEQRRAPVTSTPSALMPAGNWISLAGRGAPWRRRTRIWPPARRTCATSW